MSCFCGACHRNSQSLGSWSRHLGWSNLRMFFFSKPRHWHSRRCPILWRSWGRLVGIRVCFRSASCSTSVKNQAQTFLATTTIMGAMLSDDGKEANWADQNQWCKLDKVPMRFVVCWILTGCSDTVGIVLLSFSMFVWKCILPFGLFVSISLIASQWGATLDGSICTCTNSGRLAELLLMDPLLGPQDPLVCRVLYNLYTHDR